MGTDIGANVGKQLPISLAYEKTGCKSGGAARGVRCPLRDRGPGEVWPVGSNVTPYDHTSRAAVLAGPGRRACGPLVTSNPAKCGPWAPTWSCTTTLPVLRRSSLQGLALRRLAVQSELVAGFMATAGVALICAGSVVACGSSAPERSSNLSFCASATSCSTTVLCLRWRWRCRIATYPGRRGIYLVPTRRRSPRQSTSRGQHRLVRPWPITGRMVDRTCGDPRHPSLWQT